MSRRTRAPGTIDQREDTYRVRLMVRGERYSFTVDTTERRVAEEFAWQKMAELLARTPTSDAVAPRISDLLQRFELTRFPDLAPGGVAAYRDSLKPIRAYFADQLADPLVRAVRGAHVSEFLTWRRHFRYKGTGTTSNRTLQKDRAVLHRIFQIAQEVEWREGSPVALVKSPKVESREPVILSSIEYERLLKACGENEELRLYLLVLGETGLRCKSDALWLRFDDVDLDAGVVTVRSDRRRHRTKNGKSRKVPMSARLVNAMRNHFARYRLAMYDGERSPWLFHHERARRHAIAGQRIASLDIATTNAAKRARAPDGWVQHDLRHRRATTWIAEGRPLMAVQRAMGHSTIKVTERYVHLVDEHLTLLGHPKPKRTRQA
ncbi:MAG: tyrosine-type recombinase/integrase [Gemmatimonadaceae bacterium]